VISNLAYGCAVLCGGGRVCRRPRVGGDARGQPTAKTALDQGPPGWRAAAINRTAVRYMYISALPVRCSEYPCAYDRALTNREYGSRADTPSCAPLMAPIARHLRTASGTAILPIELRGVSKNTYQRQV